MKIDPVTFERLMSFCPQIASHPRYGKEPCLRDLIFNRYNDVRLFTPEGVNDFTKEYIQQLFEQFGETTRKDNSDADS